MIELELFWIVGVLIVSGIGLIVTVGAVIIRLIRQQRQPRQKNTGA